MSTLNNNSTKNFTYTIITVILPTIIASSLFASIFSTFYEDFFKTPFICIDFSSSQYPTVSIMVKNYGRETAKNIILLVETPYHIKNYTLLSSEDISKPVMKKNTLQLEFERISPGSGSFVNFALFFDSIKSNFPSKGINAYITYDGGSTDFYSDKWVMCPDVISYIFLSSYWPLFTILLVLIFLYLPLLLFIFKRLSRKVFVDYLIRELLFIRETLDTSKSNYSGELIFLNKRKNTEFDLLQYTTSLDLIKLITSLRKKTSAKENYVWYKKLFDFKIGIIKDINNYLDIDDFYKKLKQRNELVEKERISLNEEVFIHVDKILRNINWTQYR